MSTRARVNSAGGGTTLIFLALAVLWADRAGAETRAAGSTSACRPATFASGIAARVTDGRTLVLDDGRTVRLAGIESPAIEGAAGAAAAFLQELLAGKTIVLKGTSERDRHGRLTAHAFLGGTAPERWIQGELVAAGHARVTANSGDDCAAELMRREREARKAGLGLWSDPYYAVRLADDPAALAGERGRFAIVEGKVLSVRESGGTIYVNFGRRWSEDFTVTIAKRNEKSFTAAGMEPKMLANRRVRVRGWIEERGGPWVEAIRPEQIELVERN
jgi:endonuclease YncB( thermonuclease family)